MLLQPSDTGCKATAFARQLWADDALELDNSQLTIAEQKQWLYDQYLKAAEA